MHAPSLLRRLFSPSFAAVALVLMFAAAPIALAGIPGEAPNFFLAPPTEVDFALDTPAEAAPAAELPAAPADGNLTLSIDPSLLAEPTATGAAAPAPAAPAAETPKKGPPLPLHTTEGTGGALFVPFAYLVNPGPPGTIITPPAPSYTFVKIGHKSINQFAITTTVARRIELGYCVGIFTLGDFPSDVFKHTGLNLDMDTVTLHMFSVRGMLIEEGKYNPAITAGATFKYNPDIWTMNHRLRGAPVSLGLAKSNGTDFTLTTSKTFGNALFGRPIITSAGLRFSKAAQLGYLGFGHSYRMTWEADICYMATDWMAISYEYRQKKNPYKAMRPLVGNEDDWHAIALAFILSDRLTFSCAWGAFGNAVNHEENGVWGFQFKYEF